jgi:hypothetical protein
MIDLQELQILAQLVDNMEIIIGKIEKAYASNNTEEFNKSKKEMLDMQKKISKMIK